MFNSGWEVFESPARRNQIRASHGNVRRLHQSQRKGRGLKQIKRGRKRSEKKKIKKIKSQETTDDSSDANLTIVGICPGITDCPGPMPICSIRAFFRAKWLRPLINSWSLRCCGGWKYLHGGFSLLHRPCNHRHTSFKVKIYANPMTSVRQMCRQSTARFDVKPK